MIVNMLKKTIAFLLVITPILRYYVVPVVKQDFELVVVLSIILCQLIILLSMRRTTTLKINKSFKGIVLFFAWGAFITLVVYLIAPYSNLITLTAKNNFYFYIVAVFAVLLGLLGTVDSKYLIKYYRFVALLTSLFLLIQFLSYNFFGIAMNGKMPFLELQDVYLIREKVFGIYNFGSFVRFSSFFIEPSHFAQYIAPFICLCLFNGKNEFQKKSILYAVFCSSMVLISVSGTGIVVVLLIWFLYFLFNDSKKLYKKVAAVYLGLIFSILFLMLLYYVPALNEMVNNLFVSSNGGQAKADYRIYRGFDIYFELSFIHQLFGAGYKSVGGLASYYGIESLFDTNALYEYMNDIALILTNFGLIGFMIFIILIKRMYKQGDVLTKALLITCLAIFVSESMFIYGTWRLYIFIIYASISLNNRDKIIYGR